VTTDGGVDRQVGDGGSPDGDELRALADRLQRVEERQQKLLNLLAHNGSYVAAQVEGLLN